MCACGAWEDALVVARGNDSSYTCCKEMGICMIHMSQMSVTWLINTWAMTHSQMWHDSSIRVFHMCDMSHGHFSTCVTMTHSCMWHDSFTHMWMSHVAHVENSCRRVMSHMWMSHVTYVNESCHTCEWVMSHMWMSHVTYVYESWPLIWMSHGHTCEWVMATHVECVTHRQDFSTCVCVCVCDMSHPHVTDVNELCRTGAGVKPHMSSLTCEDTASTHPHMSHTCRSQASHVRVFASDARVWWVREGSLVVGHVRVVAHEWEKAALL